MSLRRLADLKYEKAT
jgi:hypothetical protein